MQSKKIGVGALFGLLAVCIGAFGAHGLNGVLTEHAMDIYQTGVHYHFWHALLLVFLGLLPDHSLLTASNLALCIGIVLFSGSLYLLSITGVSWLGMITPVGGVALIIGWGLLMLWAFLAS
jgi:uncharacterized membrane protein YgdD (TMEM256/DUF423 family)